ncbi:MAG: adenosylcobalamin-dependent ribonucleoside-diphosphate reductase [Nitrospiraceae bacterium]
MYHIMQLYVRGDYLMAKRHDHTSRLSSNALTVLRQRYLAKNAAGKSVETPAQMFRRVSQNIADAERLYSSASERRGIADHFFRLMADLEFLPNSPTLMNAGRELQQLSACFVLPVEDSLEAIFDSVKHQALIHQSGGGTGFSFSHLRPKADRVASTSGVASGPVSFMRIFNMATEIIKQGGTRRGANMGILRVDHPDIMDFIAAKQKPAELTNFNVSVGISDAFMQALQRRRTYPLINPRTGRTVRRMSAAAVFDSLVAAAWSSGEPGVIFLDTINAHNPTPQIGRIESTNPCGEQPLLPYESCTLGSVNVARFVTGPAQTPSVDYDRLAKAVRLAVRFLDNVVDMNHYPLPVIETITKSTRKIGLGIMGFADLLIKLNIPYDSDIALKIGEALMRFIHQQAHEASLELARERGVFPGFKGSRLDLSGRRLRNATVTTIAPTGTISIIADCSPGIEPLYGVSFARTVMEDVRLVAIHPEFIRRARAAGMYSKDLLRRISAQESIQSLSDIPADMRRLFVTAHDIAPEHHVRMQAVFQKYSDSGVSKTINLPATASPKDVASAFLLAYRLGCKGITVFRSGSREKQVLSCAQIQYC